MNTDEAWREYRREYKRAINQRDKAAGREGRMYASEFARLHGIDPRALRKRMRAAKYKRQGNRNLIR
jgi:hypothetical protein